MSFLFPHHVTHANFLNSITGDMLSWFAEDQRVILVEFFSHVPDLQALSPNQHAQWQQ